MGLGDWRGFHGMPLRRSSTFPPVCHRGGLSKPLGCHRGGLSKPLGCYTGVGSASP